MRSLQHARGVTPLCVAEGVEAMDREGAAYRSGMAMHSECPHRALTALRAVLAEPRTPRQYRPDSMPTAGRPAARRSVRAKRANRRSAWIEPKAIAFEIWRLVGMLVYVPPFERRSPGPLPRT